MYTIVSYWICHPSFGHKFPFPTASSLLFHCSSLSIFMCLFVRKSRKGILQMALWIFITVISLGVLQGMHHNVFVTQRHISTKQQVTEFTNGGEKYANQKQDKKIRCQKNRPKRGIKTPRHRRTTPKWLWETSWALAQQTQVPIDIINVCFNI